LKKITQKRVEDIDKLLKNLLNFKGADQKLLNIMNNANNPFCILSMLTSHNKNLTYQNKLLNSMELLMKNASKDNKALKQWECLVLGKEKYQIFHCTKDGKFCMLCVFENMCLEFLEVERQIIISEVGNILKSDNPQNIIKSSLYRDIVEFLDL